MPSQPWDTIVVGAGPAGLSAAIYLARFRRRTLVLHDGTSRALTAPWVRNLGGYEDGIAGADLLGRMGRQAGRYGAEVQQRRVDAIRRSAQEYELRCSDDAVFRARTLILATGVELGDDPLSGEHRQVAIDAGALRYCPVCDGFEQIDKRIAVYTCGDSGAAEAQFLRHFSDDVVLALTPGGTLTPDCAADLERAGVDVLTDARAVLAEDCRSFSIEAKAPADHRVVDVLYPSFECRARNRLAVELGLRVNASGCVAPDAPLGTPHPGLFCAGDLVEGLDQIAVAMSHGAQAATRAHNFLLEADASRTG